MRKFEITPLKYPEVMRLFQTQGVFDNTWNFPRENIPKAAEVLENFFGGRVTPHPNDIWLYEIEFNCEKQYVEFWMKWE